LNPVIQAALWGLFGGSALILGALVGYAFRLPQRLIAAVMALGSGVLISAVAFDLVDEAFDRGGTTATGIGLALGALLYTAGNILLSRAGARHRKRSGSNPQESQAQAGASSGVAIALGALLDGIPESAVIGISLVEGGSVSTAVVAAVFLSNVPEGLSSAAGMKAAGRSRTYIFGVWAGIAIASGIAAMIGNVALADASGATIAVITALAGGAILAMIVDTMVPEATEQGHELTGLIATLGFFIAFLLSRAESPPPVESRSETAPPEQIGSRS
jgi:ZIP family zinc transporter